MTHGIRLADCGDLLTVQEYSAWMIQKPATTYAQLHDNSTLVKPWTLKPSPRWRRIDCEAALDRRDLVLTQRQDRARRKFALAAAS